MAEQSSDNQIGETTRMLEQLSNNQIGEATRMPEQPSDNQIGETIRMVEKTSDNQIDETIKIAEEPEENPFEEIFTKARFQFAIKCLSIIMNLKKNKNIVFSPYSIYEGLLRIYLASSDDTEKQLRCKLNLPDNDDIQKIITNWILHTTERKNEDEKLPDYNKKNYCWITNTKFLTNMTQRLSKNELEEVNFREAYTDSKNRINEFLTKSYICTPVQLINIKKDMKIILSTVLCLEGDTVKLKDNMPNDSYEMHSPKTPRSFISTKLQMIVTELPFVDKNLSFFLLFPAWKYMSEWFEYYEGTSGLLERLMTIEGINELRSVLDNEESSKNFVKEEKIIYPNFFVTENKFKINKLLDKLGIQNLLQDDHAFADRNLQFGDATHHSYIKVTSEDVTAGTVNMFFTKGKACVNPSKDIYHSACDTKKFLWLLYCKKNHIILFMGSVNKQRQMSPTVERKNIFDQMIQCFDRNCYSTTKL